MLSLLSGFLVIDKPGGVTSRDVVNHVQRFIPRKTKIGHCGTLDPLATGVLVLAIGQATRLVEYVQEQAKAYRADIILGATSTTDDADGEITRLVDVPPVSSSQIIALFPQFTGTIWQVPPAFSAVKVNGQRSYALARKEATVELAPRQVRVDALRLTEHQPKETRFTLEVDCGKGTYIRSLARDIGRQLGTGGYIHSLRRTRIGHFVAEQAPPYPDLPANLASFLLPMTMAFPTLPQRVVHNQEALDIRQGKRIPTNGETAVVLLVDDSGGLVALAEPTNAGLQPLKVFQPESRESKT